MLYQKITDIYATAIDYSPKAYESKQFFATVQNKLHFSITGKTAAEIIQNRVNSKKDKMGLTSWRRSPNGKIMPSDVVTAKNYLDKKELTQLNRIVNLYSNSSGGTYPSEERSLFLLYTSSIKYEIEASTSS